MILSNTIQWKYNIIHSHSTGAGNLLPDMNLILNRQNINSFNKL
jgi:hypothetical protein